jgi:hypothetical protein
VMSTHGADILRLWVVAVGLCRRHPHRPGDPQDDGRYLSQAAQHDPLDARQSGALSGLRIASRSRRCPSSSG